EEPISHFLRRIPSARFEPASGPATLSAIAVETADATGLALRVGPVRIGGRISPAAPDFWS
ncbi:MAG: metallophosphoesterase, partial [Rhizobiales bacterium]|nr:metallophosphoesterase [Hyphomicrobiales bacterium]